jgi:hypothetical protein
MKGRGMTRLYSFSAMALTLVLCAGFVACDSNKKLSQENANRAIMTVIGHHTISRSGDEVRFNVASINRIGPVRQLKEDEASVIVTFKDDTDPSTRWFMNPFALTFVFQKNVDKNWVLTHLETPGPPEGPADGNGNIDMICQSNQNLAVVAQ